MALFPRLPHESHVLVFSLASPTSEHHFLVAYTDSITRFVHGRAKEKKWQKLWGSLGSGP